MLMFPRYLAARPPFQLRGRSGESRNVTMADSHVHAAALADVTPVMAPIPVRRILLVYPFAVAEQYHLDTVLKGGSFVEAPLGLGYIASYVNETLKDVEVEVFDANALAIKHIIANRRANMDELWPLLREKIAAFKPDIVGVSCLFHNIAVTAHRTCGIAKELDPSIIVVMGGNYPAGSPEIALTDGNVDFLIFSEGEKSFAALVEALRHGVDPLKVVDGIGCRPGALGQLQAAHEKVAISPANQNIRTVPKGLFAKTLDDYPWPDRSAFDMDFYATYTRHFAFRTLDRSEVRLATLTASRGCPFKCTFCSSKDFWGKQIRYREPKVVVDEMQWLKETYDINTFVFNDDNIMFNRRNVLALCNEIKQRNLKISWLSGGGIQVSSMKPDVVQALVETGLKQFNLAIETGNPETLRRISKPLTRGVAEEVIAEIRKYDGVWIGSNFITGFYFETLDDIAETLSYAGSLDLDWRSIYSFQPLPGTEDFRSCVARGYISDWQIWNEGRTGELVELNTENFTALEVRNLNYLANLRHNFLENRNLSINPAQAIRDFNYVIEMAPDHAMGYYARALAEHSLGRLDTARATLEVAREIVDRTRGHEPHRFKSNLAMTQVDIRWIDYFNYFHLDIEAAMGRFREQNGTSRRRITEQQRRADS